MIEPILESLHLRGALGAVRTEMFDGREHLVVPAVALIGGSVIHAVNAPHAELVPAETLAKAASSWNGRPVVLNHPARDGHQISANEPGVLAAHGIGTIFNSRMSGAKLLMDCYIDPEKAARLGGAEFVDGLRHGTVNEISVGAMVTTDPTSGTVNGKPYRGVWRETLGDHVAALTHSPGACSVANGCGLGRAAMHLVTAEGIEMPRAAADADVLTVGDPVEILDTGETGVVSAIDGNDITVESDVDGEERGPFAQDELRALAARQRRPMSKLFRNAVESSRFGHGMRALRTITQKQRDAIDPADFAGKHQSFFIAKPEDVAAAASSIGRAGADNYSTDELKANIVRIAYRKGASFVAELPNSWKKAADQKAAARHAGALADKAQCALCGGSGTIMKGHRSCPDCGGTGTMKAAAKAGLAAKLKSMATAMIRALDGPTPYEPQPYSPDDDEMIVCPACGLLNDDDASYCDQCGAELAGQAGVTSTDGAGVNDADGVFQPEPYEAEDDETVACPTCHLMNDDDAKYCDQCGFKLIGAANVTVEQSPEETAELVSYEAIQELISQATASLTSGKAQVDALVEAETNDPEADDDELEDARLEALISMCMQLYGTLNGIVKIATAQLSDADVAAATPMQAYARHLVGKEISAKNAAVIQTAHDNAHDLHRSLTDLGAQCNGMKLLSAGAGGAKADEAEGDRHMTKEMRAAAIRSLIESDCKCYTAADEKWLQAMPDDKFEGLKTLADAGIKTLALTKADAEQVIKDKAAADAALADHAKQLGARDAGDAGEEDDVKAAAAAKMTVKDYQEVKYLKGAPESIRTLVANKKADDAARKADLVKTLKTAQSVHAEEALKTFTLDRLEEIAALVGMPKPDFSGRGVALRGAEENDVYRNPPDPYAKALEARRVKTVN